MSRFLRRGTDLDAPAWLDRGHTADGRWVLCRRGPWHRDRQSGDSFLSLSALSIYVCVGAESQHEQDTTYDN